MIVCCIDTCRAHIVGSDAHAPLETLVESMDEVCDASRDRIDDSSLAFEDEAGCVLRGAAAMAALERRSKFCYVETLAFLHERHLRQRHLLFHPPVPARGFAPGATPPALVVRPTPPVGLGVFAGEDIAAGAVLAEYAGVVRPRRGETVGCAHDGFLVEYGESFGGETLHLSALHYGNVGRFVNHDVDLQNSDLVRCSRDGLLRVFVVSLRVIPKDAQILVDYGAAYWRDSPEIRRRLG